MILPRSLSILCCCFILGTVLHGQQPGNTIVQLPADLYSLSDPDSLSTDSTGVTLAVPIAFSPNGDEYNPYFEVETDGVTEYEFTVFTRTGTRVFYSKSRRIFWDGKSNGGIDVKEGIYYYVIEESGASDPYQHAGFVYLFR
jgi:gliding motility-associated-like protein